MWRVSADLKESEKKRVNTPIGFNMYGGGWREWTLDAAAGVGGTGSGRPGMWLWEERRGEA